MRIYFPKRRLWTHGPFFFFLFIKRQFQALRQDVYYRIFQFLWQPCYSDILQWKIRTRCRCYLLNLVRYIPLLCFSFRNLYYCKQRFDHQLTLPLSVLLLTDYSIRQQLPFFLVYSCITCLTSCVCMQMWNFCPCMKIMA